MEQIHDKIYVGIDVSKAKLDIQYDELSPTLIIGNERGEFKKLNPYLRKDKRGILVILEATGGYEKAIVKWLLSREYPVALVNAKRVRDYAKSTGQFAKNDRIDARIIREYGQTCESKLHLIPIKSKLEEQIDALTRRRLQLVSIRTKEQQHLATIDNKEVQRSIKRGIKFYQGEIKKIEEKLVAILEQDQSLQAKAELLQTIKGVGKVNIFTVLGDLTELGRVDNKKIAALVGVAPFCHDSGTMKGKRIIWGGRAPVRVALYMATLSAIKCNPAIKTFYERLLAKGKLKKVAIVACMRKLLTVMNSMVKNNEPWHAEMI